MMELENVLKSKNMLPEIKTIETMVSPFTIKGYWARWTAKKDVRKKINQI